MNNYILLVPGKGAIGAKLKREFKMGDEFRVDGQKCRVIGLNLPKTMELPTHVIMETCDV